MLRIIALIGLFCVVVGCQTGSADTAATLASAASSVEAVDDRADSQEVQTDAAVENGTIDESEFGSNTGAVDQNEQESVPSQTEAKKADPLISGIQEIAATRNKEGESAAVRAVFDCYKRARERNVNLTAARLCAAQDFVVSREVISSRPDNATGTNDRALFVAKRHAERIGALMKLKGMNQSQFNTFGAYLHSVAEPEYKKARTS